MTTAILRRRKLGRTSCNEIANFCQKDVVVVRNDQPFPAGIDLVIRWGTTSNIPVNNVLNTAAAIHTVGDKAGFRRVLMDAWEAKEYEGQPLCPYTIFRGQDLVNNAHLAYPLVVRPRVHAQGRHVYLVNNDAQLAVAIGKCGEGWYASSYINKVAEYRVAFVQGRVAWVAKKTPGNPEAVAWNVARGGRFDNVLWGDWPLKAVKLSREAFLLSGLDFGGVDVMVDAAGNAFILEINSAPSQTSPYRQECMAKCFDYVIEHGKAAIPVVQAIGDWKKFIHPALSDQARMV
jgi:glutathione synthase/RimK-type ligase-like ATP-grasp enzyme